MALFPLYPPWIPLPLLLLLLLLFLPILFLELLKSKQSNLPPGPPQLPIIGNLHQLGKMPHRSLWELSQTYGPLMLLKLGQIPALVVSSPEMAKEVLKTHDLVCCSRPAAEGPKKLSYNFLDIAFSPYSDYWREMRKICVTELFSAKKSKSFGSVVEQEIGRLIAKIDKITQSAPDLVNLSDEIFNLLNNMICRIACGTIYEGEQIEGGKLVDVINEAMAMLASFSAADFFPCGGWIVDVLTGLHGRREKCFRNFDRFYQKLLDEHLDPARLSPENEDIIDVLVGLWKDRSSVVDIGRDHIKAILMNIFLGGIDTPSITVVWAMAELIKNPKVMKKLQAEIRTSIGTKQMVEDSDTPNLPYLKMVIKETFRLHPPSVLLIPRQTMEQFNIGNYTIYPGTRIHINLWGMGRDPKIWKNPYEFYPERFADNSIDIKGQDFQLLPFGSGRRICPGISMGMTMLELTIANLVGCFDWKLGDGMKNEDLNMEEGVNLTVHKKIPLCVVPVKYNSRE